MKKKWLLPLLTAAVFIGSFDASAQRKRKRNFKYGIRSGLNYSFLSGTNIERDESLFDYHVGFYFQIPISKTLIFEPGANLSFKGFEAASFKGDQARAVMGVPVLTPSVSKLRMSFIDIPLVVKDNQSTSFSPYAGFEFNILTGHEHTVEYTIENDAGEDELVSLTQDIDNLRPFQISALIGLEYHLSSYAHINASYGLALNSIDKNGDTDIKNNTLKLAVGFTF